MADEDYQLPDEIAIVAMSNGLVLSADFATARSLRQAVNSTAPEVTIDDLCGQEFVVAPRHIVTISFTTAKSRIEEAKFLKAMRDEVKWIDPDDD